MSHGYPLRARFQDQDALLDQLDDIDAYDAASTVGARSSPVGDPLEELPLASLLVDEFPDEDEDDSLFKPPRSRRAAPLTEAEKTLQVLHYMRDVFHGHFSLRNLIQTLLTSNNTDVKTYRGLLLEGDGLLVVMDHLWEISMHQQRAKYNEAAAGWVVKRAAEVIEQEASWLTNRASEGPHEDEALRLRVSANRMSVDLVRSFRIENLASVYDRTTPRLQCILKAAMGETSLNVRARMKRETRHIRTTATSLILNGRSRRTNYHGAMNALLLWDHRVPKRLVQTMNHLGVSASPAFQLRGVITVGRDAVRLAQIVARDPETLKMLPYDNFNWRNLAWEVSAMHGTVQHDQVSAMLVVLNIPEHLRAVPASHLASVARFRAAAGTRHSIPPHESLEAILPNTKDMTAHRDALIRHVATILTSDVVAFSQFAASVPKFIDASAIEPHVTQRFYLPTFDQEQASTRGNMEVLSHYFLRVLQLPPAVFENVMFFILGDRLTTARDRAAQDQRLVDRSPLAIDHLSSFAMTSGLMHQCLNQIQNLARNFWGTSVDKDPVSLLTLRDLLPNRTNINPRKIDFYAWLRFLDVVLRSLVLAAVSAHLNVETVGHIPAVISEWDFERFWKLCSATVDTFIIPDMDHLEAEGLKTLEGQTVSGHAVLLTHDLMTLREMRRGIKLGHPGCILRMLKYWAPMFYAGGGYNYSHECMELLHNVVHDWPKDTAEVLLAGMLVNTTGNADGFLEGDMDVEHLNNVIKERAHGSTASPDILEKSVPAICHVQQLTTQLFADLGVDRINQRHTHVTQETDINILTAHMNKAKVFRFTQDTASQHAVADLLRSGIQRLAGLNGGGHSNHLRKHRLRLQIRRTHPDVDGIGDGKYSEEDLSEDILGATRDELANTWDGPGMLEFTCTDVDPLFTESEVDALLNEESRHLDDDEQYM